MTLWKRILSMAMIAACGLPAMATTARAQAIVVTARSFKDLASDAEYLVRAIAPKDDPSVGLILDQLKNFQSGDLIKGLDQSRGFGLAVTLPADLGQGGTPTIVAAVPITSFKDLLESLRGLGIAVDDQPGADGFSHRVTAPDGNSSAFVVESKKYAMFSLLPDAAERIKGMDPASWALKDRPNAAIAARLRISEVPDAVKETFLEGFRASLDAKEDRNAGEGDVEYQTRVAVQKMGREAITMMVQEGESLTIAIETDRRSAELAFDVTVAARAGTDLAKSLRGFGGMRSRFEGLGGGPISAWGRLPMAGSVREAMGRALEPMTKAEPPGLTESQRKLLGRFMALLKANLTAPEFDSGLVIRRGKPRDGKEPHFLMLMAMRVVDGKAFDKLFRDSIAEIKPEKGVQVKLDAAKAADGTPIHRVIGPAQAKNEKDEQMLRTFGGPVLAVAFRDDAVVGAFGEDGVEAVREALATIGRPPVPGSGPVEPAAMVIRIAPIVDFAASGEKQRELYRSAAGRAFAGEAAKQDRVTATVTGDGDSVRYRLSVGVPVLKFFAIVGNEEKKD